MLNNENRLLISYMYQEGYTEEDMYDERTLAIIEFSLDFQMFKFKHDFKPLIDSLVESFKSMVAGINETIRPIATWLEGLRKEQASWIKRKNFLKEFNTPKPIQKFHQVNDRKPRHLVRKII